MKKTIGLMLLVILQTTLSACVELKDPESGEVSPVVSSLQKLPDLEIDGEMFIYQGEILSLDEIERRTFKTGQDWTPTTKTMSFGRISFSSRGKLFTMGNNLKIIADELLSERGQLLTFPEGAKAMTDRAGIDGGFISLKIRHADGQLFVTMRGQDGGDGHNGPPNAYVGVNRPCGGHRTPGLDGNAGFPGQKGGDSGSIRLLGEAQNNFDMRIRREAGRGGRGGLASAPGECIALPMQRGQAAPDGLSGADGVILE